MYVAKVFCSVKSLLPDYNTAKITSTLILHYVIQLSGAAQKQQQPTFGDSAAGGATTAFNITAHCLVSNHQLECFNVKQLYPPIGSTPNSHVSNVEAPSRCVNGNLDCPQQVCHYGSYLGFKLKI